MPAYCDFTLDRGEDVTLTIPLAPPVAIGGWDVEFQVNKHFPLPPSASGLILKSMASGYYNVSGMNIVNSGQGILRITLNSVDTSGFCGGAYVFGITRTNPGNNTRLTEGYLLIPD